MAEEAAHQPTVNPGKTTSFRERKVSWSRLRRVDSLNVEAENLKPSGHGSHQASWITTLSLAFQSIGVIYGDIGTSPMYALPSTFPEGIHHKDDILGVLSLIFYTIVLVPMVKYVFIVLWANDNGDGGTFALYSLICRHANVGLIPNAQKEDKELSNYTLDKPSNKLQRAAKIKELLEKSKFAKIALFLVTILGTAMVIGDGILTPCISVLSAVGGIKSLDQEAVVWISIAILIVLFCVQRFGTDKVGYLFAPVILIWFLAISGIGLYNLFKHDPTVLRAANPAYIIQYFQRNGKRAWISLGGVILCITGTEAMFADLGHFNVTAIQISFSALVFPSILFAYIGQTAYLSKFPENVSAAFYDSIPKPIYWPMFVVANLAAIIASQAMISGAFSIVSQSLKLNCFPRVKVVHTSTKYEGQVYVPEINYIFMVACVVVTYCFKTTEKIGNAYGIAVVAVMLITTSLLALIMLFIWKTRAIWVILFFTVFMFIELVYFSSTLYKFAQGGYLPLAFSFFLMSIMGIWHYAHQQRYMFELKNKVSSNYIKELAKREDINRIPGIGFLYSELVQGIPPIFPHFVANVPTVHSVIVIVSIKNIPIPRIMLEERFLFRQVEPREYKVFRCVVRYGYKDVIGDPKEFEKQLVEKLKEFIKHEHLVLEASTPVEEMNDPDEGKQIVAANRRNVNSGEEEIQFVQKAMEQGVFYLLGEVEVLAKHNSSCFKKFAINYAYNFLRNNCRQGDKAMAIPRGRLLRVGMCYEI
ncbi:hypothetical protein BUALT_Bualt10G0106600 [Buddleja alternifolia]|uniref:Potassium transporter n=1 Tax=Buddleja alternifolia TaxID=168488 RepID=A0AAV6WZ48_9LAMI|nr:hypothetical protein BUALT_Bualt10G0106100 [Buddleja alternifolia]KAG8375503.1 hypothetical protein BUALT_Bualt10G0106600 [Buddleja alternifolia]